MTLAEELTSLLNRHSAENGSNTPDYILAAYLLTCLGAFNAAVQARQEWYGKTAEGIEVLSSSATATHHSEDARAIAYFRDFQQGVVAAWDGARPPPPDSKDTPVTRPWKDASPDFQAGYRAGWADREGDFLCAVDRIAPPAAAVDKSIKKTPDLCPVHDELWIEGTPCECGGGRRWHSGLGSTTTDVHWRCQKCGRDKYVDGIDS